jgi:YidC/Oxa1 family membrane protein insertase
MEGQGKRLLLAVVLALGIVILWNVVFPPDKPKPKPKLDDEVAETKKIDSPLGTVRGEAQPPLAELTGDPEIETLSYPNVVVQFSDRDATLVSWKLTDGKYARDWSKGEMIPRDEDGRTHGSFAVNFYDSDHVLPKGARWTRSDRFGDAALGGDEIAYRYETDDLVVEKRFRIHAARYLVELDVRYGIKPDPSGNKRKAAQQLGISVIGQQHPAAPKGGGMGRTTRETRAACHLNGDVRQVAAPRLLEEASERGGSVRWAGFNHPYLFWAVAPDPQVREASACHMYTLPGVPGGMQVDLVFGKELPESGMSPLATRVVSFIGPKHLAALEDAGDVAGFSPAFDDSVDMGWFSFIAKPLLWLLTWFYGFIGNWGVAIILLTVLVKLATLYWTTKSMRSMRGMAALKPKIEELQAKYKDDRQRLQQEMMGMYKAHGVNPLSGCLPLLLQMPIWLALYRMLSSVGELYLAPFIPGWIDDLTSTDPYYILPILVTGMMFAQSRINPTTLDSMQQKMLVYGMPLIFGVMSFFFPSGLSVYILTNSTLSFLHTLYLKKFDKGAKPAPVVAAKPAAGSARAAAKKDEGKAVKRPPPPVVDVEAEEVERVEDADDGGDDAAPSERAPAPARATPGQTQAQRKGNAPRRKKKRKH